LQASVRGLLVVRPSTCQVIGNAQVILKNIAADRRLGMMPPVKKYLASQSL